MSSTVRVKREPSSVGGGTICFVCGSSGAEHYIHAKPRESGGSFFPFLEHHVPPEGADVPSIAEGVVRSCFLCYSILNQQWDAFERTRTPHVKRLYWLKRTDNGPYMGAEMRLQGEYASQLMGLDGNGSTYDYKDIPPSSTCSRMAPSHEENSGDGVLDLTRTKCEPTPGPRLTPGGQMEENNALDLSMPDKNSVTEVCYVCGEECSRGTLINIYAKPIANCPYFPSLTLHPRPSKSRPMDSTGRVQACGACHQHLLQQWDSYQRRNTPHSDRNYVLRKRTQTNPSPNAPSVNSGFMCYTCGMECPITSHRILQAYKTSSTDTGPFFPFLEKVCIPTGAAKISAQGTVQVCSICYKSIHRQRHVHEISKTPEDKRVYRIQNSITNGNEWESSREVACYICNQVSQGNTDVLNTLPPKDPTVKRPYFPALQSLPKATFASSMDDEGRIVTCKNCSAFLMSQWDTYEMDNVPQEQRHYRVRLTETSSASRKLSRDTTESLHIQVPVPEADASNLPQPSPHMKVGVLSTVSSSSLSHYQQKTTTARAMDLSTTTSARLVVRTNSYENQYYRPAISVGCYCYVCGLSSQPGESYTLRAKQLKNRMGEESFSPVVQAAFFPFLSTHEPPHHASEKLSGEAGVALVCIFCYHSLMAQWVAYEMSPNASDRIPWNRVYNYVNYVCYVCGVTTYRKRARALSVTDYPFLVDHPRPAGSLVLSGGDRVVVCLMCYHTLHLQWNDFERMKVPVELRKYNWIAAPPPEGALKRKHSTSSNGESGKGSQVVVITEEENGKNDGVFYNQPSTNPDSPQGLPHGSKPPPLTMLPPSGQKSITRTTATVPPLSQVSPNNSIVTSMSNNPALNATRTSSFAAALRKLAKQATEPSPEKDISPVSPVSSPALSQRSTTPKRAPPPLILPGGQSISISSPPVVTIAPTQTHLTLSDGRKSSDRGLGHGPPLIEPLSIKRDLSSKVPPHGLYLDKRDESVLSKDPLSSSSSQFSHLRSHMSAGSRPEDVLLAARGFQPYRVADEIRHGIPPHMTFDHAGYPYHPMFLPPHLPPAFRLDDPLYLERYGMIRPPVLPLSSPSMLSHPGLPFLPSGRYPPELLGPPMGLISPSSAALNQERLKFEEEQRHRDREREREIERERERERERDRERERLREREREIEREREQHEREKEREQQQRDRDATFLALRNQEQQRLNIPIGRSLESPSGRFGSNHKNTDMPRDLAIRKPSSVTTGTSSSRPNSRSSSSVPNLGSFSAAALIGQQPTTANAPQRSSDEESWLQRQREHFLQQQQQQHQQHQQQHDNVLDYRHAYYSRDVSQQERVEDLRNGERDPWNNKDEYGRERTSSDHIGMSTANRHHSSNEARDLTSMHKHHNVDASSFVANHHHHPGKYHPHHHHHHHHHHQSRVRTNSVPENAVNHSDGLLRESEERLNSRLFDVEKKEQLARIASERNHSPDGAVNNTTANSVIKRDSNSAPSITSSESAFTPAVTNGVDNGSQPVISKLDLEEHRLRLSRVNGTCRVESSESDDDEQKAEKRRCQLLTIASGPPLKLDQSPKKLNFLGMFGLTTQQNKREIEFEKYVERRQRHHEPCISPLEDISQQSPRLPIPPGISPDDLLREPDYPQKVQFLKTFNLESNSKDRQREQDAIWQAVVEERLRRNGFFDPALQCLVAERQNGGGREQATPGFTSNGKGLKRKKHDKHKTNKVMRQSSPLSSSSQESLSLGVSALQKPKQITTPQPSRQHQDGRRSVPGQMSLDSPQNAVNGDAQRHMQGHRFGERRVVLMTSSSELTKNKQIKDFAQEFHESVLQTTQKQQAMKLAGEKNAYKSVSNLTDSKAIIKNLWDGSSHNNSISKPNDQHYERESYRWPGVEYLMESYERHLQEQKLEREVLLEQCQRLRLANQEYNLIADKLSKQMTELVQGKRQQDEERRELQNSIDNLKRCLRGTR